MNTANVMGQIIKNLYGELNYSQEVGLEVLNKEIHLIEKGHVQTKAAKVFRVHKTTFIFVDENLEGIEQICFVNLNQEKALLQRLEE